jgi:hypothetical protein
VCRCVYIHGLGAQPFPVCNPKVALFALKVAHFSRQNKPMDATGRLAKHTAIEYAPFFAETRL